jgi:hypothetical protein
MGTIILPQVTVFGSFTDKIADFADKMMTTF